MARWNRSIDTVAVVRSDSRRGSKNPVPSAAESPLGGSFAAAGDLYARWAVATGWRGFRRAQTGRPATGDESPRDPPGGSVRIIAKAPNIDALQNLIAQHADRMTIPPMYHADVPGGTGMATHFTAEVKADHLDWLAGNPNGIAWELAVPLRAADTQAEADPSGRFGPRRNEAALRARNLPRPKALSKPVSLTDDTVAVIDFGCPFLNHRFADAARSGTRVAALWDQDQRPADPHNTWWKVPASPGYGRELDADALQTLFDCVYREDMADRSLNEVTAYRRLDYLIAYDDPRRRVWAATHGGHVLDLAAGCSDPLVDAINGAGGDGLQQDAAGAARLLFVQLPALTASDSSGGSLGAQLLDAVRYVMAHCKPQARLVINISYGTFAGPHDGQSLLETALAELLKQRRDNFAIVLAAGNSRKASCHARRTVRRDESALLRLVLEAGDTTDTFVELWYPRPTAGQPCLQVRVRTAGRDWSPFVAAGQQCPYLDAATGETVVLLQHAHQVPGSAQAMALLALAPTAHATDDDGPLADAGIWEIEIALVDDPHQGDAAVGNAAVVVEAWVERDDPGDSGAGAQPRFVSQDCSDEFNTLSSMATGAATIVVGGFRLADGMAVPYSSLPASGKPSPLMAYAACEMDEDNPRVAASAVCGGEVHRMNGTSVAAPVLARRLFNTMKDRDVAREEWPAVLQELAAGADGLIKLPV